MYIVNPASYPPPFFICVRLSAQTKHLLALGSRKTQNGQTVSTYLQWWAPGRVGMGTSYKSASGPWRIRKLYIWRSEFLGTNRGVKLRRIKYELSSMVLGAFFIGTFILTLFSDFSRLYYFYHHCLFFFSRACCAFFLSS